MRGIFEDIKAANVNQHTYITQAHTFVKIIE